jgi:hypothetical protein
MLVERVDTIPSPPAISLASRLPHPGAEVAAPFRRLNRDMYGISVSGHHNPATSLYTPEPHSVQTCRQYKGIARQLILPLLVVAISK